MNFRSADFSTDGAEAKKNAMELDLPTAFHVLKESREGASLPMLKSFFRA
jgi:hypothetical protein